MKQKQQDIYARQERTYVVVKQAVASRTKRGLVSAAEEAVMRCMTYGKPSVRGMGMRRY